MDIKQARIVKRRLELYYTKYEVPVTINIRPSTLTSRIGEAGYQVEHVSPGRPKQVVHDPDYLVAEYPLTKQKEAIGE